ncbi:Gfo/Idh/MocA family protein [Paenibacillus wynnii]|uniref:Gfo/Idh/MocA family protein n=1 Tax=Paenibacillus wynnii TaxID=268407 RepID=UPI002794CEA5|nr:Gfo/Idh/MocA family oxidoreductase [Paenibacillus wynnii]MDQ0194834.1 putative dehydrogenase [Paenibacillus wynnii]
MKALVIGCGSIGSRHADWLSDLGCQVSVVSGRDQVPYPVYPSIEAACQGGPYDYTVIATSTSDHYMSVNTLALHEFNGILLVEKPLFHTVKSLPEHAFQSVFVAYNLRFHPIVLKLRELLENEKVLSVQVYVGQYLPEWRPLNDYRQSYSASKFAGGGVLRDLSHELDYITWILGGWKSTVAVGGHYSRLEIDSDDVFGIMLQTDHCPVVNIQLNYLDRKSRRELIINTNNATIKADLILNTLEMNKDIYSFEMERDYTYRTLHRSLLQGKHDVACTAKEGLDVLHLIEAVEMSAQRKVWVDR